MTASENCCLKWFDFQKNIAASFSEFKDDPDFSDVTLVCEDNQQINAHRVILSASSAFFNSILKKNKQANTLIYMRGVWYQDLTAIVDFIYLGKHQ